MAINRNSLVNQVENLFTVSNGMTSWWNLRLFAAHDAGAGGASVELQVNGASIPDQRGAVQANVDPTSYPQRTTSVDVRLNDGDVVSVNVQGPSSVNVSLSGEVCSEQL